MDRYISEADQYRVALTLGQLMGVIRTLHDIEETEASRHLCELAGELRRLLLPRTLAAAADPGPPEGHPDWH